jgi:hypothetical protein
MQMIPYCLGPGAWDQTSLPHLESQLARTPCRVSGRLTATIFPDQATPALLAQRW